MLVPTTMGWRKSYCLDGPRQQARPVDGHRIRGAIGDNPERRLVGEIPTQNRRFLSVAARQFRHMVGLNSECRVKMRMPALTIRYVPIGFADFPADQQTRMEVNVIAMRQGDQEIERTKCLRIVITGDRGSIQAHTKSRRMVLEAPSSCMRAKSASIALGGVCRRITWLP